jgi:hypothetical protein
MSSTNNLSSPKTVGTTARGDNSSTESEGEEEIKIVHVTTIPDKINEHSPVPMPKLSGQIDDCITGADNPTSTKSLTKEGDHLDSVEISKKPLAEIENKRGAQDTSKLPMKNQRKGEKSSASDDDSLPPIQASNLELIIKRSNNLCDRWHRLGLGTETGTVALNTYLVEHGLAKTDADRFTVSEMVQSFETLRPRIKALPSRSEIRNVMVKSDFGEGYIYRENENSGEEQEIETPRDETPYKSPFPTESLAKLYELMSTNCNFENFKRRKLHHLDGDQVIDQLISYENRVCELEVKEDQIIKSFMR